jgi:DNA-binding HxlR family transcriptional regulator
VVTRTSRTYDHYCSLARALERVGDRWTLLILRDLLSGSRRFTDLADRLGGITPKTLSGRLRELVDDGIVEVDRQQGRREVRYRLTAIGEELAPAVEALTWWGLRNAHRPPLPGEPVHAEHLLKVFRLALSRMAPPGRAVRWRFEISDDRDYTLSYDLHDWLLTDGDDRLDPVDLVVRGHSSDWAHYFLATSDDDRAQHRDRLALIGPVEEWKRFERLIRQVPDAVHDGSPQLPPPLRRSRPETDDTSRTPSTSRPAPV